MHDDRARRLAGEAPWEKAEVWAGVTGLRDVADAASAGLFLVCRGMFSKQE
ncbi:hypothetical protein [Microbacterium sp. CH12i]|uniref:hypothetical protein n=1 Tax=Microbacterium sp. CH12i TaxID=1479651 RepID=UPI000B08B2FC|nr:hypothetical protein [Microbacterium sp. CH12i]